MGITLSLNERKVLTYLVKNTNEDDCYSHFAPIMRETGLDRNIVRRACRRMARYGLTAYDKGLCSEDGDFLGAGYAATRLAHLSMEEKE